jgi:hypothetical protein
MRLTIQGAFLFLFIPLVLFLYLRQPLGPGLSIALGVVVMFGHRLVAAPWMARHAAERCLWCGRHLQPEPMVAQDFSPAIHVMSAGREHRMTACSPGHRDLAARFLTFIARYRAPIAIGIFVPLVVLLLSSLFLAAGRPLLPQTWNVWQFRTIVAFTVVVVSMAYRTVPRADEQLRSPFPLHNLFLLGIRNTLWVFRLVGAWWLVAGAIQLLRE